VKDGAGRRCPGAPSRSEKGDRHIRISGSLEWKVIVAVREPGELGANRTSSVRAPSAGR